MRYLLDANVLIALGSPRHEHHQIAHTWLSSVTHFSVCPITEGALVRYMLREKTPTGIITDFLNTIHTMSGCEFWPDDLSYTDVDYDTVIGHRQATDTYLAALAAAHSGKLATFDQALARRLPDQVTLISAT
ncbi:MAG: PIN domain-containing protein [Actinomycetaceae bacterium]|nr:PIN domain-containing protein [Actinomycetaceae bacterium]